METNNDKNPQENIANDIKTVINTENIPIDNSSPLEETQIQNADLGTQPYVPKSVVADSVNTVAPVSMLYEMNKSLTNLDRKVRGVDYFVMTKLGYADMIDLCNAFSAEQVDAIAMAIEQIDKGMALIEADGTGTGKGRTAAAIARYAKMIGKKPIIFTEKVNLFSDLYRDFIAIGMDEAVAIEKNTGELIPKKIKVTKAQIIEAIKSDIEDGEFELDYNKETLFDKSNESELNAAINEYRDTYYQDDIVFYERYVDNPNYKEEITYKKRFVPFIINSRDKNTDIKDERGNIIYRPVEDKRKNEILESKILPDEFDCVLLTYSQISNPKLAYKKAEFIKAIAINNIFIMDESHNASGKSQTGKFMQEMIETTIGGIFLSATFAKRPDNLPIYAMKTTMRDTKLSGNQLVNAILYGGHALQEIISSQVVSDGQMVRRERSYQGVDVNYIYLNETQNEIGLPQFNLVDNHKAISDKITSIVRRIIFFQETYVKPHIEKLSINLANEQASASQDKTLQKATIDNVPLFSGIFQLINQLLFSLKAEAVAEYAIMRMKQGKKPVIAFASTLESFLDYLSKADDGETIPTDFSIILKRRLERTLSYTINLPNGEDEKHILDASELGYAGAEEYESILEDIEDTAVGITISPIDAILDKIRKAGFTVDEVTGRNRYVEFLENDRGYIKKRSKPNASDVFRKFNNNQLDCILINQAGSTGASAHSIKTDVVNEVNYDKNNNPIIPTSLDNKKEVKQRVMIILQAEGDVNKEVQKRGRINRTGQVFPPIYDYVISAIPAEMRLMMMLQKKLKSLDANTTSNQKQSKKVLDVIDFLNIYGDIKVQEYLEQNPEINNLTGNILKFEGGKPSETTYLIQEKANKVTGRVAILSTMMQEDFYNTVSKNYEAFERQLKDEGNWNLEVEKLNLEAKTLDTSPLAVGNPDSQSVFGGPVILEKCEINNLRKPFSKKELKNLMDEALMIYTKDGKSIRLSSDEITAELNKRLSVFIHGTKEDAMNSRRAMRDKKISEITKSKAYSKLKTQEEKKSYVEQLKESIEKEFEESVNYSTDKINLLQNDFRKAINTFKPNTLIAYPFEDGHIIGICLGLRFNWDESTFIRSQVDASLVFPNSLRRINIPVSSAITETIYKLSTDVYEVLYQDEKSVEEFVNEWERKISDSRSERIIRYIVTGNILKAFGLSEYYRKNGKLISYSTIDKQNKKGFLLPSQYTTKKLTVAIPIITAKKLIKNMAPSSVFYIGESGYIQRMNNTYRLYSNKFSYNHLHNDEQITLLAINDKWEKRRSENYYWNDYDEKNIMKVVDILESQYKVVVEVPSGVFESIQDDFDITIRSNDVEQSMDDFLRKYNEELENYEKEQEFEIISESQLKKMDDLEKENYLLKKQNLELRVIKKFVDIHKAIKKAV